LNGKGFLFSLMAFILVGSLIALHEVSLNQSSLLQDSINENNSFKKVSDKYANVKNNFVVLTENENEREIDQRILPFGYTYDSNSLSITSELPMRQSKIDVYLESLNAFRVFLEDVNYSQEFDSMNVDINTLIPVSWGGTSNNISYIIDPQCLKYSIIDSNQMTFEFVCADYNYMGIRRHDLNVAFKSVHDFNSLSCNFNGSATCFSDDFNSQSNIPYLNINLVDDECPNCNLGQTSIRGHFDPSQTSSVDVACTGATCTTPDPFT